MASEAQRHWLDWYGGQRYDWQEITTASTTAYARRLGIVESFFDHDGLAFVGRADVTCFLKTEVRSALEERAYRDHVLLAWASLLGQHALMRARAVDAESDPLLRDTSLTGRWFVVEQPKDTQELLNQAERSVTFLSEHGLDDYVDPKDFFYHTMNANRCFDCEKALCRLFVLPLQKIPNGHWKMHTVVVLAHEATDGLSANFCNSEFIDLLNESDQRLLQRLEVCSRPSATKSILPPAQEALYQPLAGNAVREKWQWAISRVLRHKRKPPLDAFKNPLKRHEQLNFQAMEPRYANVLDYSLTPPNRTFVGFVRLGPETTSEVVRLCKEARASVGSGLFALVALSMMALEEEWSPSIPIEDRLAYVASFPLNVRPFLKYDKSPDSIMLGFSDGLSLPFLPSHLPAEGRFRLLARQAHRQLKMYQKGVRSAKEDARLGSRSPAQVIPIGYLSQVERYQARMGNAGPPPQGELSVPASRTGATNGISSVGNRSAIIRRGKYALDGSTPFAADFRELACAPRARDGEFLCAAQGDGDVLNFHVACDGNTVDEGKFEAWRHKMETMLGAPEPKL